MTNKSTIAVLSNGTRIAQLKSDAKRVEREQDISHAEALAKVARGSGYDSWEDLIAASWELDEDGDVVTQKRFQLFGMPSELPVVSAPLDEWEDWAEEGVPEMVSVDIAVGFYSDTTEPYLHVSFVGIDEGTNVALDMEMYERMEDAVASGSVSDRVAVQGALVEEVMGFYEADWLEMTARDVCKLERFRLGISQDEDLFWQEPTPANYGANQEAVRIYRAGPDQLLVCYESDSKHPGEEVFGMITDAQYDAVPHNPYNYWKMMNGYLSAAGLTLNERDERDPDMWD
ncbi:hypothetical protein [Citreimonas salinaria]|uniref:Uncharacterized protein n=1 Tax=Citreimonas salinaria TaxID=321339 RepID=A0A1H3N9K4_9RHOB|nr:hypothetical protein [Citreimonas salinaria]SDY85145.1 hypothetical protein SAMN05444340_12141 [Citreimonas salinaria]